MLEGGGGREGGTRTGGRFGHRCKFESGRGYRRLNAHPLLLRLPPAFPHPSHRGHNPIFFTVNCLFAYHPANNGTELIC